MTLAARTLPALLLASTALAQQPAAQAPAATPQSPPAPSQTNPPRGVPEPDLLSRFRPRPVPEPTSPPAQHIHDPRAHLSLDLPPGWNFSRHDGDLSSFAVDAHISTPRTRLHEVASLAFNPFPFSTFSGANFYVSTTPRSNPAACSTEAPAPPAHPVTTPVLSGTTFHHGYSEHGSSCTESRDEVYTTLRAGSCLRFDLIINTFCGGEVSGARDMTASELAAVRHRLETVLNSVHFEDAGPEPPPSADLQRRSSTTAPPGKE